ncbi:MAG: NAD(P)-dependent oxidoreductase [Candidatus Heimdallarchaeota archaeon]|nr:NAD(P)-dependent oxidoreductase [Candidatus Heimdallarchaeota archaeon]MCK5142801.1 NAD(P)-dependent oxidoreductase [Candidatus Heimdallarchaeota archaeon]
MIKRFLFVNILITGAFGNLGLSTIKELVRLNHQITCFDLPNRRNKRAFRKLSRKHKLSVVWGNISDTASIALAIKNQDCIIHLVAILPPLSDKLPDYAYKINVLGTNNIIEEVKKQNLSPRIIYASSVTVYGPKSPDSPVITLDTPINPTDVYSKTKVEAEELLVKSCLPWIILRLTAVPALDLMSNMKLDPIFSIPLQQKLEFLHTFDAGVALARSVDITQVNRFYLIGGGKQNQFKNKEFLSMYFKVLGLGNFPTKISKTPITNNDWYYTLWMDSTEAQELLKYLKHTYEDFLSEFKKANRFIVSIITLLRPLVKQILIMKSPYSKTKS